MLLGVSEGCSGTTGAWADSLLGRGHRLRRSTRGTLRSFFRFDFGLPKLLELPKRPEWDIAGQGILGHGVGRGRWPRWATRGTRTRPTILTRPIAGPLSGIRPARTASPLWTGIRAVSVPWGATAVSGRARVGIRGSRIADRRPRAEGRPDRDRGDGRGLGQHGHRGGADGRRRERRAGGRGGARRPDPRRPWPGPRRVRARGSDPAAHPGRRAEQPDCGPRCRSVPGLTIVSETRFRSWSTPITQTVTTSPTLTTSCGLFT